MAADLARLRRCLNPRSIAVVGGSEAAQVVRQCRKLGFGGDIWPVNPVRDSIEGLDCRRRLDELPGPPDAAFIAIPAEASIEAVETLSRMGAGGAVCYASGFREIADGNDRHHRLIQAAGSMPVLGPNCYGFINLTCGAALWPDYHGARRVRQGVAIFSQSGNVSLNLSMQRRMLPLAWLVTLGNQAVVGIEEGIAAALDSECITAIGLHLEGLNDLPRFAQLAEQAARKGIPIVALKAGRSEIGARITLSHTATLAGEGALYDALFERLGIGRVATPEEFIEALKLVSISGALPGNRIASMSCSGGEATLVADLCAARALEFPALDDHHRQQVQATLNQYVRVDNPLDYHTFIWGDQKRMTDTFGAMMAANFDLTLFILDTPADDREALDFWLRAVEAFIEACRSSGNKGALVTLLSENLPEEVARLLIENGIAPLQGLAQALAAVEAACDIGRARGQSSAPPSLYSTARAESSTPARVSDRVSTESGNSTGIPVAGSAAHRELRRLDEFQAKTLLARAGFSVPQSIVVDSSVADSSNAAVEAAAQLGYPVVLKALSEQIAHKTESGALAVNLGDARQVHAHATRLFRLAGRLLVEKMIEGAVAELLLGVGYDRQFGHYLIIGFGGTLVELIGDRELLLPPVDRAMLERALGRLKTAPLLHAYRGRPAADVEAVIECALRLNQLIENEPDNIVEIEINPLMVKSENQGAVVADALITVRGDS